MANNLWTAYEAAAATGGALCARGGAPGEWLAEEWSAGGVSIDTRTLKPGEIFVALEDARDGHEFVRAAFERGAAAALVARAPNDAPDGAPFLVVNDTLTGLRALAAAARGRNFGKRIGVTGSVGKTSTKEMLRTVLSACGQTHAADKSFNNHFGVPLTLASLPMRADFGVFEIGMNHAGEITPLTNLVCPHAAIITTVGEAHIENLGSREAIAEAKAEILSGVLAGGAAVLPYDNDFFELLKQRAEEAGVTRLITFGEKEGADYQLISYTPSEAGGECVALIKGTETPFSLSLPGKHHALNALAVFAAAIAVGADPATVIKSISNFSAGAGRGARLTLDIGGKTVEVHDESYNANPTSMRAAIEVLAATSPKEGARRIAIIGEMLELGPDAPRYHAEIANDLASAQVARVYAAGGLTEHLWTALPEAMRGGFAAKAEEIAAMLIDDVRDGDIILVKGSNASKVGDVIKRLESAGKQDQP
ncbi:MAG: UDP-N-acetylmuramoyl-tripeptide--D-alanyl-D-alanine ligase [Pseudomonadota bacterium]